MPLLTLTVTPSLTGGFGCRLNNLHRPQQTGGHKFRVSLVKLRRGQCVSLCDIRLPIANDTVHPGIRHSDFERVRAGLQSMRAVHAMWRLPSYYERLPVDKDFREVLDL